VNYKSLATGISIIALLLGSIITVTWPGEMTQFATTNLAQVLFDNWGPTLIVLGAVLFSAMIGAVYIAQEDRE
jgi:NADH:ubiquinone oxidoreductase subunit 6 (subunit J)